MSRKRILTYIVLCVSIAVCFKFLYDLATAPENPIPSASPEEEVITVESFPKGYCLGTFDDRFGITRDRFLQIVVEAKRVWENAAGKELFQFKANGRMKINLVFDSREESLLKAKEQRAKLDENGNSFEMLRSEYERKASAVEREQAAFNEAAQSYQSRLDEYNSRVNRWNNGDNRTESESQFLQSRKLELDQELAQLEPKRTVLRTDVDDLNALGERVNTLAKKFNLEVEVFNGTYITQREFEKGVFDGRNIDIYEFDKEEDLRVALVHEFGHALGIEHVDNPRSIMYRKLAAQDMTDVHLTSEDLTQLLSKIK